MIVSQLDDLNFKIIIFEKTEEVFDPLNHFTVPPASFHFVRILEILGLLTADPVFEFKNLKWWIENTERTEHKSHYMISKSKMAD